MVKANSRITQSTVLNVAYTFGNTGFFDYGRKGLCEIKPSTYTSIYALYAY
jgi:hypothetical protein